MGNKQLAYCGLNCDKCPLFIATANNDNALREKTFKEWSKIYADHLEGLSVTVKDMSCRGCLSDKDLFIAGANCSIRKCCREKKYATCAECVEYQTCQMLNGFYSMPAHRPAKDNLDRMRTQ
jgi:hypothetical protein